MTSDFSQIVTQSPKMLRIFDRIRRYRGDNTPMFITGESCAGSEVFARAIHDAADRRDGPFVPVYCGTKADSLADIEILGDGEAAFLSGREPMPSAFERADGGSLFLKEITEISMPLQRAMVDVIKRNAFTRFEGAEPVHIDVRIIASTMNDMKQVLSRGLFRLDLYVALMGMHISIPPLRERKEDIALLVEHFIGKYNRIRGMRVEGISGEAIGVLVGYDWPGNVGQLEHVIARAVVLREVGSIELCDLQRMIWER